MDSANQTHVPIKTDCSLQNRLSKNVIFIVSDSQ